MARPVVLAVLRGSDTDAETIRLACRLARDRGAIVRGLYVMEVPHQHPLGSWHEGEDLGWTVISTARDSARRLGCELQGSVLPARDAGQAIVDESVEWAAELVVMAAPFRSRRGDAAHLVLEKAVCGVVIFRPPRSKTDGPVS